METLKEQNDLINSLSVNMEEAITHALECYRITTNCLQHCLSRGGSHVDQRHITLLKECSEITNLAARFMMEKSEYAHDLCGVCALICQATADQCAAIDAEDPMMSLCISACRRCAESCRNMEH